MPKIYFNRIVPANTFATKVAAGYVQQNVNLPSLNREYRSTDAQDVQQIAFDFGLQKKLSAFFVSGLNSDNVALTANNGVGTFISLPMPMAKDGFNRYRGIAKLKSALTQPDVYAISVNLTMGSLALQPTAELTYKVVVQLPAPGNGYEYRIIKPALTPTAYVVAAGDQLRYDVFCDAANPQAIAGGMEIEFTTAPFNARVAGVVDQNATPIQQGSAAMVGAWFSRQLSLTPIVGKTLTNISLVNEGDVNGAYVAKYRNIRITTSANVDKMVIWRGGRTQVNLLNIADSAYGTIIAQGDTTDNADFWRCGAVYAFSDVLQLAPAPDKNYVADYAHAQQSQKIINGNTAVWGVGTTRREISLEWLRKYPEQLQTVLTETRKGICVLDMENPLMPENVWPVMCLDERLGSRFPRNNSEILTGMKLTEVC